MCEIEIARASHTAGDGSGSGSVSRLPRDDVPARQGGSSAVQNHAHPSQTVVDACAAVIASGVLSPSCHGNFSWRADQQRMLLSGAGLSTPPHVDDLSVVTLAGLVDEGQVLASVSEVVGTHAAVYRARAVVSAVVQTHSPAVTGFALARRALPSRYEARLRHGPAEPVPVVAWAPRRSATLWAPRRSATLWAPRRSATLFRSNTQAVDRRPATSALSLADHGLLAIGTTPQPAANLVIARPPATGGELAASLGGSQPFPARALEDVQGSMTGSAGGQPAVTAAGRS